MLHAAAREIKRDIAAVANDCCLGCCAANWEGRPPYISVNMSLQAKGGKGCWARRASCGAAASATGAIHGWNRGMHIE